MERRPRRWSRSGRELARAPISRCQHCGRDTKTVSGGVCADCWGIKDPERAIVPRREPKTWPLLDWRGWEDLSLPQLLWVAAAVVGVILAIVVALR